jgi:hypothetical protein
LVRLSQRVSIFGVLVLAAFLLAQARSCAEDGPAEGSAAVFDVEGKEIKLSGLKFGTGTRRLSWLADPKGTTEDARKGPVAVEIREEYSTMFAKGVITLVEVSHIESIKYDFKEKSVSYTIKGLKEPLKGTTQYKGLNALSFGGLVDGKATAFMGGPATGKGMTVKSVTFGGAKDVPETKATGTTWSVQIVQPKEKDPTLTVRNLKVMYQYPGYFERLETHIPVREDTQIPLNGGLKRFEVLATDNNTNRAAAEVETATGPKKIVIVPLTQETENKAGTLVGFLGEVDAGWKLFPLQTIKVITLKDVKKKVE